MIFREPNIRCINRILLLAGDEMNSAEAIYEHHNRILRGFGGSICKVEALISKLKGDLSGRSIISTNRHAISICRISILTISMAISTLRIIISTNRNMFSTYRPDILILSNTISTFCNSKSIIPKEIFDQSKGHNLFRNAIIPMIYDGSLQVNH